MPVTPAPGRAKIRKVVNSSLAMATAISFVKKMKKKATQVSSTLYAIGHKDRAQGLPGGQTHCGSAASIPNQSQGTDLEGQGERTCPGSSPCLPTQDPPGAQHL